MSKKTRNKSGSHLSQLIGTGKEFVRSELPTTRDILRFGILQREISDQDKRNFTVNELVNDIYTALLVSQWKKASLEFSVLLGESSIKNKRYCGKKLLKSAQVVPA